VKNTKKQSLLLVITLFFALAICGAVAAEDPGASDSGTTTVSSDAGTSSGDTTSGDTGTDSATEDSGTTTDSSNAGDTGTSSEDPSTEDSTIGDIRTTTSSSDFDSTINDDDGSTTSSNSDSGAADTPSTINSSETTTDLTVSDTSQGTLPDPQIWRDGVPVPRGGHPAEYQYTTIAEAINDAQSGDTIMLEANTFNEQITINKNLNINVLNNGHATLDGTGLTGSIITINPGVTVNISNLTIQNGNSFYGGGIYNNGGTLTVIGCTFTNNTSAGGGGGICNTGTLTLTGSTFTNNTATGAGGGIGNSGTLTITGSTFTNNTSTPGGGGIYNTGGTLTVTGSTFTHNTATVGHGGGIRNDGGTLTVTGSTFTNNTSAGSGGGISNHNIFGAEVHFNRIVGNSVPDVYSESGSVNAEYNWWGTNFDGTSPLAAGRVVGNVDADPWLVLTLTTSNFDHGAVIRADLLHDSQGGYHNPTGGHVPDGIPVTFNSNSGVFSPGTAYTENGVAETIFKARNYGSYTIQATVDSQTIQTMNILRGSGSASTLTISTLTIISTIP